MKNQIRGIVKKKQEAPTGGFAESMLGAQYLFKEIEETKEELTTAVDEKIEEVESVVQEAKVAVAESTKKIDTKVAEFEQTAIGLIQDIQNIPTLQGNPGTPADEEKIIKTVLSKIPPAPKAPKLDETALFKRFVSKLPENKASLKIIQEIFETDPMLVIDKILALPEDKFRLKTSHITGLDQTIRAIHSQIGQRGYLHGGGDTVVAGTNITLTRNTNGTVTINSTGGGASPLTTKGDLYTYSTVNARLPVGTNGQLLSADSTEPTGLKWVTASGSGTVTEVSVVTANGVSGSVANATTTPAITLTLGAITPTSVAAIGTVTGSNLSGTNTGDQTLAGLGGANTALSNLAAVAINTSLISDTDSTDNLGSTTVAWANLYVDTIRSITGNALALTPVSGQSLTVNLATTGDFAVNTSQLYVDTSAASVGIGTTAMETFYRTTNAGADQAVVLGVQNANGSRFGFAGVNSSNSDLYFIQPNASGNNVASALIRGGMPSAIAGAETGYLIFYTKPSTGALAEAMRINTAGAVAIGTATPQSLINTTSSPFLDITSAAGAGTTGLVIHDLDTTQESAFATAGAGLFIDVAGHATASNNFIAFRTNPNNSAYGATIVEAMRITSAGTVGIGNTPAAGFRLEVGAGGAGSTNEIIKINGGASGLAATYYYQNNVVRGLFGLASGNDALVTSSVLGDFVIRNSQKMLFSTDAGGTASMVILTGGNVGIGTTNPSVKFHVAKDDAVTNTVTDVAQLNHSSSGTPAAGFGTGLLFTAESSTTDAQQMARIQATWSTATHASRASTLDFQTVTGAGALTTQLSILGNGTAVHSAPVRLKGYTVATLPAGVQGDTAFCTDLLLPAFLAVATGGGAVVGPVFYDGTNWVSI